MQINNFYNKNTSFIYVKNAHGSYCPQNTKDVKNLHPRVVLKFNNNSATCPYCSLKYKIKSE